MKYAVKTALSPGKIGYSLFFVLILCLARGISFAGEIKNALDAPMALLTATLCADIYFQEITGNRWETFALVSKTKRRKTLMQRVAAIGLYAILLLIQGFILYLVHRPGLAAGQNVGRLLLEMLGKCIPNSIFFGALAFFLVQLSRSLWMGLGIILLLWAMLNSSLVRYLPDVCALFTYQGETSEAQIGYKITLVLLAAVLAVLGSRKELKYT